MTKFLAAFFWGRFQAKVSERPNSIYQTIPPQVSSCIIAKWHWTISWPSNPAIRLLAWLDSSIIFLKHLIAEKVLVLSNVQTGRVENSNKAKWYWKLGFLASARQKDQIKSTVHSDCLNFIFSVKIIMYNWTSFRFFHLRWAIVTHADAFPRYELAKQVLFGYHLRYADTTRHLLKTEIFGTINFLFAWENEK